MSGEGMEVVERIKTVEWEMLDKSRFFPLWMASSFSVRCFLYPLTLIRTRLQIQYQSNEYTGTMDAAKKIFNQEGFRGFYRGFFVSAFQIVSGVCYVSTYEGVRHLLERKRLTTNDKLKAFVGGGCASVVGQSIIVPFDVISQHMMMIKTDERTKKSAKMLTQVPAQHPLGIQTQNRTKRQITLDITRTVYQKEGVRGFYRGYMASLCTYVPSSASWWAFYHLFQDSFYWLSSAPAVEVDPDLPHTLVQCVSAMASGCATCVLTNPLDLTRARVQVHRKSIPETVKTLWREEGFSLFKKGLTARMTASAIYSVAMVLGYESVKKIAVYDEFKSKVMW